MAYFIVKTLPKGFKIEGTVSLRDLTEVLLETNSAAVAKSSVQGSRKPVAAFEDGAAVFSNLDTLQRVQTVKKQATPPAAPKKAFKASQQPRDKKAGPNKGRFDHVKPAVKREVIVERV